ncbi:hypothetical protein [Bradyrhizobium sp. CER78]|uniref:hypothetical protein n=1 Tax=Bradyrhizobium sp. CER78 TaxID=3039162 RepID=UPI00244A8146|nr:hypothetical protein [Bradyrhizobium sp. CER78]MDH2386401.1 hypothetical protein [Bradyrhizobium sp. CER78]
MKINEHPAQDPFQDPMIEDPILSRITLNLKQIMTDLRQLTRDNDVVAQILYGRALTLKEAADVWRCSDETVRKECKKVAAKRQPIGHKVANRWIVCRERLLDRIEQNEGPSARSIAERRINEMRLRSIAAAADRNPPTPAKR